MTWQFRLLRVASLLGLFVPLVWAVQLFGEEKAAAVPLNDSQFNPLLVSIAKHYEQWGRADDENRLAPELCAMFPARPHLSESGDLQSHGAKFYYIYALDPWQYMKRPKPKANRIVGEPSFPGNPNIKQVIVKESWQAIEVSRPSGSRLDNIQKYAFCNGKWYGSGNRTDLFIMAQFDSKRDGTDDGWIYGTVAPDRKTATSSGRVKHCMDCHALAPGGGRLFGLDYNAQKKEKN